MSDRQWKPGDVVLWNDGLRVMCTADGWIDEHGDHRWGPSANVVRPLVVIDPEDYSDGSGADRLAKALVEAMHAAGDERSAANGVHPATVATALHALANPTPEPLPEPTDPAVRVVDGDEWEAARIGDDWVSATWGPISWEQAWYDYGPLRIVTSDAPTADADRPLKVGDRVRVGDDATAVGFSSPSVHRGKIGRVTGWMSNDVAWVDHRFIARTKYLTRIEPTA